MQIIWSARAQWATIRQTHGQFEKNVATTGTNERVEFAIKLPGATDSESYVWLPIDSKFAMEDYQRLVDASERGDLEGIEQSSRDLEGTLKLVRRTFGTVTWPRP